MKITCKYCGIVDKPHHCPRASNRRSKGRNRLDNKVYRGKGYRPLRGAVKETYDNVCLWSLYIYGKAVSCDEVHHIVEVLEDDAQAKSFNNLIPLSYKAHREVHKLYNISSNLKHKTQELLRLMCRLYRDGIREPSYLVEHTPLPYKDVLEVLEVRTPAPKQVILSHIIRN